VLTWDTGIILAGKEKNSKARKEAR